MQINARPAEKFFRVNHVTLADVWGLSRIDTETFFSLVLRRIDFYRQSLRAAGFEANAGNVARLHLDSMSEDCPVDQAVLAALTFALTRTNPPSPAAPTLPRAA